VKHSATALIAVPTLLLALLLSACGGPGAALAGSNAATVLVAAGGLATWPDLDPIASGTANADYRNAVFGELFHLKADGSVEPSLASGYKVSEDYRTVDIRLRTGVTFSDGTPFDADAVATNFKRDLSPAGACSCKGTFALVTSVSAVGGDEVVLKLAKPMPAVMPAFSNTALNWIASPTALKKLGKNFGKTPVGAGPFVVKSNDPSQRLVLGRNPHYYVQGEPRLDQLTFQSVGTDQSAYAGLESASAQIVEGMTTTPLLIKGKQEFDLKPIPATQVYQLTFNSLAPPLNNPLARAALVYATDSKALDQGLFNNMNKPSQSPTGTGGSFHVARVPGYKTYDPARARKLVKQLGGLTVSIQASPSNVGLQMSQALQSMWGKVGIKVSKINQVALPQLTANYASHNWQVTLGFSGAQDPALNLGLSTFFSTGGPDSGVADPQLDSLIHAGASEVDRDARGAVYQKAFKTLSDKTYADFLFENQTYNLIAKDGITGVDQPDRWIQWQLVSAG
jgi:peptide/nickel transport system substrate-binding protein